MNYHQEQQTPRCPNCSYFELQSETLSRCSTCGLGKTLSSNLLSATEQEFRASSDLARQERQRYLTNFLYRDILPSMRTGRVLDVGCGEGIFLDVLEQFGFAARGLEPYPGHREDPRIIRQPVEELNPDSKYDLISLIHSLEHFDDPAMAIAKIRGLQERGAYLFIAVPNFGGLWSRVKGRHWPWLNLQEHRYHFTSQSLRRILEQNGYNVMLDRTSSFAARPPLVESIAAEIQEWIRCKLGLAGWPQGKRPLQSVHNWLGKLLNGPINSCLDQLKLGHELVILATAT